MLGAEGDGGGILLTKDKGKIMTFVVHPLGTRNTLPV